MRKLGNAFWFCFGTGLTLSTAAAQEIPPACQQYLTAIKVCGVDLIRLTELKSPQDAPRLKAQIDLGPATDKLRQAVQAKGPEVVGQICATSPEKEQLQQAVTNIVTLLGFNDSMSEGCQSAYSAIR